MDPFSIKAVFQLEDLEVLPADAWHGFELTTTLKSETLNLAEAEEVILSELEPKLLELHVSDVLLDDHELHTDASTSSPSVISSEYYGQNHEPEGDIWAAPDLVRKYSKNGLLSWDRFNERQTGTGPHYLSEAASSVFDAVTSRSSLEEPSNFAKNVYIDSIMIGGMNVLVGRSSKVFHWNETTDSFESQLKGLAMTGYSVGLTTSLCERLCTCGSFFRLINTFCRSTKFTNPTVFAIQTACMQALRAIEIDVESKKLAKLTLISLGNLSAKYIEIYTILKDIISTAQESTAESQIIAYTIRYITGLWPSSSHRPMLAELADKILESGIRDTYEQMGLLQRTTGIVETDGWVLAGILSGLEPQFRETLQCLQIGKEYGIQIYLSAKRNFLPGMAHTWSDLARIQHEADLLELRSCNASSGLIHANGTGSSDQVSMEDSASFDSSPFNLDLQMRLSESALARYRGKGEDRLVNLVLATLNHQGAEMEAELPPSQMLFMTIRPILDAQHRVCSYALLKSLFLQHHIVDHLNLLHKYQLLGNGTFAANLSNALFDADQHNAEGRRVAGLTAGLRLENREVWPPASSELRLVLMGLLSESSADTSSLSLLEHISFAIRDLAEDDLELCRNVHSIHALDFLRLTYMPSNHVIELIITPTALDKYDDIFKFLLVLLRMHALAQCLVVTNLEQIEGQISDVAHHRFYWELHHFVTSLLHYAINVVINMQWQRFMRPLQDIQHALLKNDYNLCMSLAGSISQLGTAHERVLDEILAALFLRRKQTKILAATYEIFNICLRKVQHDSTAPRKQDSSQALRDLRQALTTWFAIVGKLVNKTSNQASRVIEELLDRIDHSHYYRAQVDGTSDFRV